MRPVAATGLRLEEERLRGVALADGSMLDCDAAVICCGVRSAPLAAQAGDRVPLQTERGYHVMLQGVSIGPRHSVSLGGAKMVVNAMHDGLRAAGQVEIAATDASPDWRRAEILRGHLLRSFPGLPQSPAERTKLWMGHRPSTPDGLPCLGPSPPQRGCRARLRPRPCRACGGCADRAPGGAASLRPAAGDPHYAFLRLAFGEPR
ncbi:NAD(P)/FAD-dependent oxidoreductase [Pseudoroseomonas wenyumeiae]